MHFLFLKIVFPVEAVQKAVGFGGFGGGGGEIMVTVVQMANYYT